MNATTTALTRQMLEWIAARPREHAEVMEAWRTSCPRLSIWEDACLDGLLQVVEGEVRLTVRGTAAVRNFTSYSAAG